MLKTLLEKYMGDKISKEAIEEMTGLFNTAVSEKAKTLTEEAVKTLKEDHEKAIKDLTESHAEAFKTFETETNDRLDEVMTEAVDKMVADNAEKLGAVSMVEMADDLTNAVLAKIDERMDESASASTNEELSVLTEKNIKLLEDAKIAETKMDEMKKQIFEYEKSVSVLKNTTELTETQRAKIASDLGLMVFESIEDFTEKVKEMKEALSNDSDDVDDKDKKLDEGLTPDQAKFFEQYTPNMGWKVEK